MPALRRGGEARNPNRRRLKPPTGTVAFLFTDIEDFTVLSQSLGSAALAKLMNQYFDKAVSQCIHKTEGTVVNTVTIDGVPCLHMFFSQPPGIELELWVEKNDKSLPRRLIVTYRTLPGEPNFIAEFSDWNFNIHPSDTDFTFQPPADAAQVQLKPVAATGPPVKGKAKGQGR